LNLGLFNKPYLATNEYTIADMICYPWASLWQGRGIDPEEFPNVRRWLDAVGERPAVKKGIEVGRELREDPATISPDEQLRRTALLSHQRAQEVPKEWT
jgi:GSH-dependent disulfide-bond oxidoreductase